MPIGLKKVFISFLLIYIWFSIVGILSVSVNAEKYAATIASTTQANNYIQTNAIDTPIDFVNITVVSAVQISILWLVFSITPLMLRLFYFKEAQSWKKALSYSLICVVANAILGMLINELFIITGNVSLYATIPALLTHAIYFMPGYFLLLWWRENGKNEHSTTITIPLEINNAIKILFALIAVKVFIALLNIPSFAIQALSYKAYFIMYSITELGILGVFIYGIKQGWKWIRIAISLIVIVQAITLLLSAEAIFLTPSYAAQYFLVMILYLSALIILFRKSSSEWFEKKGIEH